MTILYYTLRGLIFALMIPGWPLMKTLSWLDEICWKLKRRSK